MLLHSFSGYNINDNIKQIFDEKDLMLSTKIVPKEEREEREVRSVFSPALGRRVSVRAGAGAVCC